jgi:predicted ATPase
MILLRISLQSYSRKWAIISSLRLCSSSQPQCSSQQDEKDKYKFKPGEVYEQRIASKDVSDDEHQRRVIDQLNQLSNRIRDYTPPLAKKPSYISQLFFGDGSKAKRAEKIPKGVYLWGTVGGGKTQ